MDTEPQNDVLLQTAGGEIIAPNWPAVAALHARISAALAAIQPTIKDSKHALGYTYTSWAEAAAVVAQALTAATLTYTVTMLQASRTEKSATVELCFTLADPATGAMKSMRWQADGADITKASTTATKHFLTKLFLLSDQDPDAPHLAQQTSSQATRSATQTAQKTAAPAAGAAGAQKATTAPAPPQPAAPPPTVNTATGEISQPATTPPIPAPSAPLGLKHTWAQTVAKSLGWTPLEIARWKAENDFADRPDAAMAVLADWAATHPSL